MTDKPDNKNAMIMVVVFGVLTMLFFCGGGFAAGVLGANSEQDGVNAVMAATGPACCAVTGLLVACLSFLVFPGKKTAQLIAPMVAGIAGGLFGAGAIFVFFVAIFPAL